MVCRQVGIVRVAAEGELQDLHAGQAEALPERRHLGRNGAEVLGNERQSSQFLLQCLQQGVAWRLLPFADDAILTLAGNGPVGFQAAEMVDTQHVHTGKLVSESFDPPGEAIQLQR